MKTKVELLNINDGSIETMEVSENVAHFIEAAIDWQATTQGVEGAAPAALGELFADVKLPQSCSVKRATSIIVKSKNYETLSRLVYSTHPERDTYVELCEQRKALLGKARSDLQVQEITPLRIKIRNRCGYLIRESIRAYVEDRLGLAVGAGKNQKNLQERFDRLMKGLRSVRDAAKEKNPKLHFVISHMIDAESGAQSAWSAKVKRSKAQSLEAWAQTAAAKKRSDKRIRKVTEAQVRKAMSKNREPIAA